MPSEGFKRKLTAILSADVKDYSRLMGEDEDATVRTLTAHQELVAAVVQKHRGRVVDSSGDNVLAEFGSVLDAVRSAVEIQEEVKVRNAELPENRRMQFRIGINLGDVITEGERIYGDGINVAARLEGLAEGGGICVSGTVYDHVRNKLALGFEFLGEQKVKNIAEPVRVYRIVMEPGTPVRLLPEEGVATRWWQNTALAAALVVLLMAVGVVMWMFFLRHSPRPAEVAVEERMAFPLPDKPSIAVLPFVNMSGDPEQDYLADGISENTIMALSKVPEMFVVSRSSTFTYKGRAVKVQQVSEELGVRYVLEGSVQKSGKRLRVTAQLIDATSGHHLWSERYDRDMEDLFTLMDEITKEIVVALQIELTHGEQAAIWQDTDNLEAWGHAVKGYSLHQRYTKTDNAKARKLFERALELDPEFAAAKAMLAWTHLIDATYGFSGSRILAFKRAVALAQEAAAMDDTQPEVHSLLGGIHLLQRQYDEAIAEGEKSIVLNPNNALSHILLSQSMRFAGRFEEAVAHAEGAIRLSPYYPAWYLTVLSHAYRDAGRYEEALASYTQLLERCEKGECPPLWAHIGLAGVYVELGREEEARRHAEEVLRLHPSFSLETWRRSFAYKDSTHVDRLVETLQKAGLKKG
jgi:adenylate cyclase